MQRLLILLLICLLPMQVFAGTAASQADVVATLAFSAQQHESATQCSIADDCSSQDTLVDDLEMHVDLGDETVPAFPFVFAAATIAAAPALSNDKARQPPFLPPAGPPPRA
ncbi:hypothetical protein CAter10_4250 [Collimonas arenae]|nr:hypothetical protein [Collimonas arenae]AMP01677.1 hypothetical protein CAter10_4250 [Collimonas arenae]